jgi:hypothetical protein
MFQLHHQKLQINTTLEHDLPLQFRHWGNGICNTEVIGYKLNSNDIQKGHDKDLLMKNFKKSEITEGKKHDNSTRLIISGQVQTFIYIMMFSFPSNHDTSNGTLGTKCVKTPITL